LQFPAATEFCRDPLGNEQTAESEIFSLEVREKHTSGAKARLI